MSQVGKRWTDEEISCLKQMYSNGFTPKDIADKLQRKEGGIRARLEMLGLTQAVPEDIAKELFPIVEDLVKKYSYQSVLSCVYRTAKLAESPGTTDSIGTTGTTDSIGTTGTTGTKSGNAGRSVSTKIKVNTKTPAVDVSSVDQQVTLDPLTKEQCVAFDMFLSGESFCLTGPGGTGKSHIIKHIKQHCQQHDIPYAVTAMTGVAASLIGGQTLHAWTGLGLLNGTPDMLISKVFSNLNVLDRWQCIEVLVIDEVSMMNQATFELLNVIACGVRKNDSFYGGIQVIFCCDFAQLPPVEGDYAFESPHWLKGIGTNTVYLENVLRQDDPDFIKMLMQVRLGKVTSQTKSLLNSRLGLSYPHGETDIIPTVIYPHRKSVDSTNTKELAALPGEKITYTSKDSKYDFRTKKTIAAQESDLVGLEERSPKTLVLCQGAQVMLTVNLDTDGGLVNGSRGIVVGFTKGNPDVKFGETVLTITPATFESRSQSYIVRRMQIPLVLAWATTIHKCQGSTLTHVIADLSKVFCNAQGYVTLSRMKSLQGLYLQSVDYTKFGCDRKVVAYYDALKRGETYTDVNTAIYSPEEEINLKVCLV
jgi:ATP-dependent DNA helicase PIF1